MSGFEDGIFIADVGARGDAQAADLSGTSVSPFAPTRISSRSPPEYVVSGDFLVQSGYSRPVKRAKKPRRRTASTNRRKPTPDARLARTKRELARARQEQAATSQILETFAKDDEGRRKEERKTKAREAEGVLPPLSSFLTP